MEFDDALEHVAIFHHHYFISSTLPHLSLQPVYSYLVGCNQPHIEDPKQSPDHASGTLQNNNTPSEMLNLLKVFQYKNSGPISKV